MAMGTRKKREVQERQEGFWVVASALVRTPAHAFYDQLNKLLEGNKFDVCVEHLCRRYYQGTLGRPSIEPGVYFRALLLGYFEGIDSERGIAWRLADSLSMRRFIAYGLTAETPDHSTISRTRRLYSLETHKAVFRWVLKRLVEAGLVEGKTVAVDATTLEANAAMRSLVRRENGQSYEDYLKGLARAAGMVNPTKEQLARWDRKRKKKGSNKEWKNPHDPEARVTKMKDGSTHLAYKAEHGVDLSSGALLAVTIQGADKGDTTTIHETLAEAGEAVAEMIEHEATTQPTEEPKVNLGGVEEAVADKGYHSGPVLQDLNKVNCRGYIPEPDRGKRKWAGKADEQKQVYANRRRIRGERSKRLQRKRTELTERSMAHMYETGGMRRVHLRGKSNILKRVLIHAAGFNLALIMRKSIGVGKPRRLQGVSKPSMQALSDRLSSILSRHGAISRFNITTNHQSNISLVTIASAVTSYHQCRSVLIGQGVRRTI